MSDWILVAVLVKLTFCKEGSEMCEEQGKVRGFLLCHAEHTTWVMSLCWGCGKTAAATGPLQFCVKRLGGRL